MRFALLLSFPICMLILSCGTSRTWVIRRWQNGGIIGYQGDKHNFYSDIKGKVHCEHFRVIRHLYKSKKQRIEQYFDDEYRKLNMNMKIVKKSNYRRIPASADSLDNHFEQTHWREVTYKCFYHPYFDYSVDDYRERPPRSYYDTPKDHSSLPYCNGYYGFGCRPKQ